MKADFTTDLQTLGQAALTALLSGEHLTLVLPDFWERPRNFPLPVKRDPAGQEQPYRPLAVFEWIREQKEGEKTGERTRAIRAAKANDTSTDWEDDEL